MLVLYVSGKFYFPEWNKGTLSLGAYYDFTTALGIYGLKITREWHVIKHMNLVSRIIFMFLVELFHIGNVLSKRPGVIPY